MRSHRYITTHTACQTWDNTVWTEGIRKPWATPTATLANIIAELLAADPGVSIEAVDHKPNETMSMRRPPQRCAAQPPGTCTASTVDGCLHQGHLAISAPANVLTYFDVHVYAHDSHAEPTNTSRCAKECKLNTLASCKADTGGHAVALVD